MGEAGNKIGFSQKISVTVERHRKLRNNVKFKAGYRFQHFDKHGKLLHDFKVPNGVVDVGLNSILDVYFGATTQITVWQLGIIDNSGFTALADTDTMSSHAGWTEFTSYAEATRPVWTPGAASAQTVVNAVTVDFNINATGTIQGILATSDSVKGGTAGTLWGTALFTAPIPVSNGDLIKLTYTNQAA